jgi:phenylalanyl-tRNA synthetase beta chain
MKFPLSWLREHLETSASLEEITTALTRIGLEVEHIEDRGRLLAPFVVAQILEAGPHPDADRLRLCRVDTGQGEPVQVVCGAANARTGLKSVFAPAGTYIPGKDITLGIGKIRGVESFGMLCSAQELKLKLGEESDGIMELADNAVVGTSYPAYAGLDDPIIEINLTPNRADCASIRGIARDLAAAGLGVLVSQMAVPVHGQTQQTITNAFQVHIDLPSSHLCPLFAWRHIHTVKIGPSPSGMQQKLQAIGQKPIHAAVDITNFLTFDQGRPLHVFDAAKLRGDLVVRLAHDGESFQALDNKTYMLSSSMLVIADEMGVQALAGIIGGLHSAVSATTTDIVLESALWDPLTIARTGRQLGILSDARYRFERGVDPDFCLPGLDMATHLILEACGGEAGPRQMAGEAPDTGRVVEFPWSEIKRLSGIDIPRPEAKAILQDLGFLLAGPGDVIKVSPPSWRADIEGKADLVEEVIRIAGLDRVKPAPLPRLYSGVPKPALTPLQKRTGRARRLLASRGLKEAMTWSFIAKADASRFGGGSEALALDNPIAEDLSDMRPSLLPGLLRAAQRNTDRGYGDLALFELGQCFLSPEPDGQVIKAAGLRRNIAGFSGEGRHWQGETKADLFEAKADLFALLDALGLATQNVQIVPGGPDWLHPGRSGTVQLGPKTLLGFFGEPHPALLRDMDIKGLFGVFEVTLDALPLAKERGKTKGKLVLSSLQPVTRDFAFLAPHTVRAQDILRAASSSDKELISDLRLFDRYDGKGVDEQQISLGLAVTFQPKDRTLTEADLDALSARLIANVTQKTGAVLRG